MEATGVEARIPSALAGGVSREQLQVLLDFPIGDGGTEALPVVDAAAHEGVVQLAGQGLLHDLVALERLAVRLAACKGNAYDIRTLRQILRKMERVSPTRVWEYYKLNRAFHLQMAAAASNKALMSALESLWDQATNFQMFTMYSTEELRRLVAPHEYLVDVAEREDAAEIACAVSQHIAEARANLLRKLDCHQPSAVYRQPPSASHGGRAPGGVGNRD